jgi:RND superfamily putative drug exporter
MFNWLGKFVYQRRWLVLVAGLIFIIVSGVYGTSVFGSLKGGGFDDPNAESSKAAQAISQQLGRDDNVLVVLFSAKDSVTVDQPEYKQAVETTLARIEGKPGVHTITTFYNSGAAALVSNDRKSTYAVIGMSGDEDAQKKYLMDLRPLLTGNEAQNGNLQVRLGGAPAVNEEVSEQVSKDLEHAETMTFPILAVLLILIFGSLIASALPLLIGGLSILGAFLVLKLATNVTDVSIFAVNVITMLGLGLAIDYSLFMVSRFREELPRHNGNVGAALSKTMQTAGRTVMFSGLTVAISLLSLLVFPQMFLKSMGMGGAAAVLVAMLAALTVLPAILALLGRRVNSLSVWSLIRRNRKASGLPTLDSGIKRGFWYNISTFVMRRPGLVLIVTLVPLVYLGLPFLRVNLSTPDARSLPEGRESRVVSEILDSQFPKNETSPIQLVVNTNGDPTSAANLSLLYDYTRQIAAVPGVRRVDSLVNLDPKLDKASYQALYSEFGRKLNPQADKAASFYAKGNYTLISVLYDSDPRSSASQEIVRNLRTLGAPEGMNVQVGGASAQLVDFLTSLEQSVPVALGLIVGVIFVLLFLMLGSLIIPLKAVILNILSLSVSFGALVWVFQDGNLANFLNFTPLGSVDGTQPVLIFAIAFGLSMDYEVFLLSRIKEQYNRTHDTTASVALGVQKTGQIITSAALLLVVVIGAFATGEVVFIKQIGVGLGLAVLVDATVVRMLLVPATMRLLGKYNWWAPAPLTALYNRLGLSEVEEEEEQEEEAQPVPVLAGSHLLKETATEGVSSGD